MIEFNPKGNDILDQELGVSGLEMNVEPLTAITAFGSVLSGGASLFGAFSSANSASRQFHFQQQTYASDIKTRIAQTELQNAYTNKAYKAQKADYYRMRDYDYKTAVMGVTSQNALIDFEHFARMKEFKKSQLIGSAQFGLNSVAAQQAIDEEFGYLQDLAMEQMFAQESNKSALDRAMFEGILATKEQGVQLQSIKDREAYGQLSLQTSINQLLTQSGLQKEAAIVEGLVAEGTAQLGQAGKSRLKTNQSILTGLQRSLGAINSELTGKYKQAAVQLAELGAETDLAEIGVGLNLQRINEGVKQAQEDYAFNTKVMKATMDSAMAQAERNIQQIQVDRMFADLNTFANMMLEPERMPYLPIPEMPPEQTWVKPMKLLAPEEFKYRSGSDKLAKALRKGVKSGSYAFGSAPDGRSSGSPSDGKTAPYLNAKGKVKKGFTKTYRQGQLYYQNVKTGESYRA